MKITLEIDAEVDGEWKDEYEDELIEKFMLPQVIVIGEDDDDGCAIVFKTITWTVADGKDDKQE